MEFYRRVFEQVAKIPPGCVATYGQVAKAIGYPNAVRAVGNALHKNSDYKTVPCHRVVSKDGKLARNYAFGGNSGYKYLLEDEGITIIGQQVQLYGRQFFFAHGDQ